MNLEREVVPGCVGVSYVVTSDGRVYSFRRSGKKRERYTRMFARRGGGGIAYGPSSCATALCLFESVSRVSH